MNVAYSKEFVDTSRKVSLEVKDTDVNKALTLLLKGTNIGFRFLDDSILFYNKEYQNKTDPVDSQGEKKELYVKGKVTDENTDFEVLKYLNNLEELVLDSVEVDEEVFEYVLMLKKLKRIIFNACNIISEYKIEELPVKKIEFISTSLMDWGILIAMPNLKEVVFTVPIYEHNLDVVKKLENHNVKVKKYDLLNQ